MAVIHLIDDEPDVTRLIGDALRKLGHEVHAHLSARAFFAEPSSKPDLIVTDMLMSGMDGFKFCEQLRKQAATKSLPIIIITGFKWGASGADHVLKQKFGVHAVLHKPFPMADLLAAVGEALGPQPAASKPATPKPAIPKTGHRELVEDRGEGPKPISVAAAVAAPTIARRVHNRLEAKFEVGFPSNAAFVKEFTDNISAGGMFVRTMAPPPLFSQVTVQLSLPDGDVLPLPGTVVHHKESSTGPVGFGLQLDKMDDVTAQRWHDLVAKLTKHEPGAPSEVLLLGFQSSSVSDLKRTAGLFCRADVTITSATSWSAIATRLSADGSDAVRLLIVEGRRGRCPVNPATLLALDKLRDFRKKSAAPIALISDDAALAAALPADLGLQISHSRSSEQLVEHIGQWLNLPVRSMLRVPFSGKAVVASEAESLLAEANDISIGGMRLLTAGKIQPGRIVTVKFSLPGTQSAQIIAAKVRWVRAEGTDRLGFGVAFERLEPATLKLVEDFVESQGALFRSLETLRQRTRDGG